MQAYQRLFHKKKKNQNNHVFVIIHVCLSAMTYMYIEHKKWMFFKFIIFAYVIKI